MKVDLEKGIHSISDVVGEYSLQMITIITLFSLMVNPYKGYSLAFLFLVGLILNILLNRWLKEVVFKQFNQRSKNDFPSGHFQSISYGVLFYTLFVSKKRLYIYLLYLFIAGCTFYNCVYYKYHTYLDMIGGVSFGLIVGLMFGSLLHIFSFHKFTDSSLSI